METLKQYTTTLVRACFLLALVLVMAVGCGDSSTDSGNDDGNDNGNGDDPPSRLFNSGTLSPDATYSYTFEDEGDFDYFCQLHAGMTGLVIVSADADSTGRDTVMMQGMAFVPAELTVAPNTEVVWINSDDVNHTVTSGTPDSNDSGNDNEDPRY